MNNINHTEDQANMANVGTVSKLFVLSSGIPQVSWKKIESITGFDAISDRPKGTHAKLSYYKSFTNYLFCFNLGGRHPRRMAEVYDSLRCSHGVGDGEKDFPG